MILDNLKSVSAIPHLSLFLCSLLTRSPPEDVMKKSLAFLFVLYSLTATASHIVGGEFQKIHISGYQYRFNLILYYDEINNGFNGIPFEVQEPVITASIFKNSSNLFVQDLVLAFTSKSLLSASSSACATSAIVTSRSVYSVVVTLAPEVYDDPQGYYIAWQRCCRNYVVTNIYSEPPGLSSKSAGQTFYMEFPATIKNVSPVVDSSPQLARSQSDYACINQNFYADFSATDADGDSLVYSLETPLSTHSFVAVPAKQPRPYPLVTWRPGYSLQNIMNGAPDLRISHAGIVTVKPTSPGLFAFSVKCEEYRGKIKIGEVRREYQIIVLDCPPAAISTAPVITARKPGGQFIDSELDVVFGANISDDERSIVVKVDDADAALSAENIRIKAIPLGFTKDVSNIVSAVSTAALTSSSPSAQFVIRFDQSPPLGLRSYRVAIIVYDDVCGAPLSDTVTVDVTMLAPPPSPSPQIISFAEIGDKVIGTIPFLLDATTSSGMPVSYSSSNMNIATVSLSGQVTMLQAGRVTITATQPGGGIYAAAHPIFRSFCVAPLPPVINLEYDGNRGLIVSSVNDGNVWFKNGVAQSSVTGSQIFFDGDGGSYNAKVDVDGCISQESNTIVVTSVQQESSSDIRIFPNPAKEKFQFSGADQLFNVEIVDMNGKIVWARSEVKANQFVDVHGMPSGIYTVRFRRGHALIVERLIIARDLSH
jgi:hypothetical protein